LWTTLQELAPHLYRTPFPREFLREGFPGLQSLIEKKVQHDIFLPFEYRRDWVLDEFRFWTEQYLLRAFLTFNSEFEVLLANYYLSCYHEEHLRIAFPDLPRWIGGSFWMRRKSLPELSI